MESVIEFYDAGASPKQAVVKALEQTGHIICVAGLIMFTAFVALMIGSTPVLNQIGLLLCVGVLIDCFVTTKIIIPCAMALLPGDSSFWPRRRAHLEALARADTPPLPEPDDTDDDASTPGSSGKPGGKALGAATLVAP